MIKDGACVDYVLNVSARHVKVLENKKVRDDTCTITACFHFHQNQKWAAETKGFHGNVRKTCAKCYKTDTIM